MNLYSFIPCFLKWILLNLIQNPALKPTLILAIFLVKAEFKGEKAGVYMSFWKTTLRKIKIKAIGKISNIGSGQS